MNNLQNVAKIILALALAVAVGVGAWWIVTQAKTAPKADKPAPPATVPKVVKEDDLNTVTLTEEAERRIGLTVARVEKKAVRRARVYGGEVTVPVGKAIPVAAPLGGVLKAPEGGVPQAGASVRAGQSVFYLTPLLTPDGRATLSAALADADGQVNTAKAALDLAEIALRRAERVLKEGAGSQRQVDETRGAFETAQKTLTAADARLVVLKKVVGDAENGTAAPIAISAPESGMLRVVSALPGQTVPNGAALFEVVDLSTVWVRVPLPVGDFDGVERTSPARVGALAGGGMPGTQATSADPVPAPPSANPLAGTVDVYYRLANTDGKLHPGQRLGVTVPLTDAHESLTVPWSAVLFDIHGGTWAYTRTAPHVYTRRRVTVRYTVGLDAVLASGPAAGAAVVTAGAQELFGAETGFIK